MANVMRVSAVKHMHINSETVIACVVLIHIHYIFFFFFDISVRRCKVATLCIQIWFFFLFFGNSISKVDVWPYRSTLVLVQCYPYSVLLDLFVCLWKLENYVRKCVWVTSSSSAFIGITYCCFNRTGICRRIDRIFSWWILSLAKHSIENQQPRQKETELIQKEGKTANQMVYEFIVKIGKDNNSTPPIPLKGMNKENYFP